MRHLPDFCFFPALKARLCFQQYLGHIHVSHPEAEAKFQLRPSIELARNIGLNSSKIKDVERIVESRQQQITDAWHNHFGG
jgi:hypothetical protein